MDFKRIFVTGDLHGDIDDLFIRSKNAKLKKDDLLIILGDCGFEYNSYWTDKRSKYDDLRQKAVKKFIPATILCIQGNHEVPFEQMHGNLTEKFGANVIESNGIYFALNGETLTINDKKFLVIGGAYSVDKDFRLRNSYPWWPNEQLSKDEMKHIFKRVKGKKFDYVLSHACPYNVIPDEMFLQGIKQDTVDNSMERFLQKVYDNIKFKNWFCGHWHTEKLDSKVRFMYHDINTIEKAANFEKIEVTDVILEN